MATINRQDGIEFVVQPYRELLAIKNLNILKQEVRNLANTNGSFVRLLKRSNGYYEAIFSHDPGFLLGESIWNYFGKPQNFIYVEELNKHEVICVVVRNNAVFLDGKFSKEHLNDELKILNNSNQKFLIYVFGDVPLIQTRLDSILTNVSPEHGAADLSFDAMQSLNAAVELTKKPAEQIDKFSLNPDIVKSFVELTDSVYKSIKVSATLQLLNLEQALQEHSVNKTFIFSIVSVFVIVIIGVLVMVSHHHAQIKQAIKLIDPYATFKTALMSPAPNLMLQALAHDIEISYSMPGWSVQQVDYQANSATFVIHSLGGNFASLYQWAKINQAQLRLDGSGATVVITNDFTNRQTPFTIANAQEITARIIDNAMLILPGKAVKITQTMENGVYKTMGLEINIQKLAPDYLTIIGDSIINLPVQFVSASFQVDAGLLTGTIQLTVLGN